MHTVIYLLGSLLSLIVLYGLLSVFFSPIKSPSVMNVAFWFTMFFFTSALAVGCVKKLLKRKVGNFVTAWAFFGMVPMCLGFAVNVFSVDPRTQFQTDGGRHDWLPALIALVHETFGPWGVFVLFFAFAMFFAWLTVMAVREEYPDRGA